MPDTSATRIPYQPTSATRALTKLDILEVVKEAFIERTYLLYHFGVE
jgi:hypothetical protein